MYEIISHRNVLLQLAQQHKQQYAGAYIGNPFTSYTMERDRGLAIRHFIKTTLSGLE